jgi:diguanylate cyclase (GGDEF)-like protein
MIFFSYVLHKRLKNDDKMKSFAVVGIMIVAACILYELARYTIVRYTGVKMLEIKGISSFGFIVFIGVLVLDLYQRVTRSVMEEHEKAILVKRAYTDELTQLHNRGYCTEYMHSISEDKTHKYTIINLDLNGLKKVNDTYGHIKGDELICYAAIVMDKTFSADGVVGRMGGDEFIAIIDTGDRKKIEQLIDSFNNNIAEINKQKPDLGLSISYGYAVSDELVGEGPEKVYHLADKRMYEYKKKVKAAMLA